MRISKKVAREIVKVADDVTYAMLDEKCEESRNGNPPEFWSRETKHDFDLITEVGYRIEKRLEEMLGLKIKEKK